MSTAFAKEITVKTLLVFVTLVVSVFVTTGVEAQQGGNTPGPQAEGKSWQSDWDAYVDAFNECLQSSGCNTKTKFQGQTVTWQGVLDALGSYGPDNTFAPGKFYPGEKPYAVLKMNPRFLVTRLGRTETFTKLYLSIPPSILEQWKHIEIGTTVQFRVGLGQMGGLDLVGQAVVYRFGDIEPATPRPNDSANSIKREAGNSEQDKLARELLSSLQYGEPGKAYSRMVANNFNKGLLQLDEFGYGLMKVDDGGLDRQWFLALYAEVERLGGEMLPGPSSDGIAFKGTPGLVKNGKISLDDSSRHLARLKGMKREFVTEWIAAGKPILGSSRRLVIHLLVQHDPLFEGSTFSEDRAKRELARLKSLPQEAVAAWAEVVSYPLVDSTFSLLAVDSLFSGDSFQKQRFEEALPLAKKLIEDASSKK